MGALDFIPEFIREYSERKSLIKDFNQVANLAFVSGQTNLLLKATTTVGEYNFKHSMSSNIFISGFKIEIKVGDSTADSDILEIGKVFLSNKALVRQLLVLGYDTFIVLFNKKGKQWNLSAYADLKNYYLREINEINHSTDIAGVHVTDSKGMNIPKAEKMNEPKIIQKHNQRPAKKPANSTDGPFIDITVNIEPVKVELCTDIKESANAKLLGAVLLFPSVVDNKETGKKEDRKYWVSFDHLFACSPLLFNKFYDNNTGMFVNACKVGIREGQPFLAA